jgi:hypothetical protein
MIILGFWSMWSATDAHAVALVPDIRPQRASQLRKYSCINKIGAKSFAMNIRHFQQ